jgi:predicted nuclease with TOPRIM domain
MLEEKKSVNSLDKSACMFQDNKRIERLTDDIQALSNKQKSLDMHFSNFGEVVERLEVQASSDLKQTKQELCSFVNKSLSSVEERITDLVQTTLTESSKIQLT